MAKKSISLIIIRKTGEFEMQDRKTPNNTNSGEYFDIK